MKSASDNIPALYFYVESWITGTQDLTPQQRGIYIQQQKEAEQIKNHYHEHIPQRQRNSNT